MLSRLAAIPLFVLASTAQAFVEGPFGPAEPPRTTDASGQAQCVGGTWLHAPSGALFQAGVEGSLREPPVLVTYGYDLEDGVVVLPRCPISTATIRIPVLLVDFADYDPRHDLANPNNPSSGGNPNYVPTTPQALASHLNGPGGVREYFHDVSNGMLDVEFWVYGWLRSSAPGAYLKARADYMYTFEGTIYCDRTAIMRDALRDAVVQGNVDFRMFDRVGGRDPGLLANAVMVYEGNAGLCSGTNYMFLDGGSSPPGNGLPAQFYSQSIASLVVPPAPDAALFATQTMLAQNFNNIPENYYTPGPTATSVWAHEIGHALVGYPDYYAPQFRHRAWALAGGTTQVAATTHPAAWEKWVLMHWLSPAVITHDGVYALRANEKPDGSGYGDGTYLYVIYLDAQRTKYVTIENRWFAGDGNTSTQWADQDYRESGLTITRFDWRLNLFAGQPQTERQFPPRAAGNAVLEGFSAFRPGDSHELCNEGTCLVIDQISAPGAQVTFRVSGVDRIFGNTFDAR